MNKYATEDYFSVIEINTGKKICDCGEEKDAIMMVSCNPTNRTYTRNQFLMGQVVDVEVPKQLPTSNISVSTTKENGCYPRKKQLEDVTPPKLNQSNLKELKL